MLTKVATPIRGKRQDLLYDPVYHLFELWLIKK